MKILQLDVNKIEYEPVREELKLHDPAEKKKVSIANAIVLLVSAEKDDVEKHAHAAVSDAIEFAKKQKVPNLVIYPYAHISDNLEEPEKAMKLLNSMKDFASGKGVEVHYAPFGWTKKLSLEVKGHPMEAQLHTYSSEKREAKQKKERKIDLSILKKSDWSGLPENDHRSIGERQELYSFQEFSPAMAFWHPRGHMMYRELLKFIREKEDEYDYLETSTPIVNNVALFKVSGHLDHFSDNMFIFDTDIGTLALKPMSCPSTIMIYKSKKWSYRDLPFRTATFDKLYRRELSGVVTGLLRVKEMTQDDGHIFVREDQMQSEIAAFIKMTKEIYDTFGVPYEVFVSTMPDEHLGDEKLWERATSALKKALELNKVKFGIKDKEGAFYGPKIEFHIIDSLGRAWQCGTAQVDYQMPIRFELEYTGEDGKQHTPVMIHRAALGTLERFIAVMIEHFKGKFPTWLSPTQVKVIPISEQAADYADEIYRKLKQKRVRVEVDSSSRTLEYRIRDAQVMNVPYMVIVGKKEKEAGTISIRSRIGAQVQGVKLEEFIKGIREEIDSRSLKPMY